MMLKTVAALFFLIISGGSGAGEAAGLNAEEVLPGENPSTPEEQQEDPTTAVPGRLEPLHFSNLKWRSIGPAVRSGRISDIAVVESDPDIIYVGTAGGGAFKSVDGGITWDPVFEKEGSSAIGGIAVAQSNPNVVWIATGESSGRNLVSTSWGDGVYKSEDAGKSWTHMGLRACQQMGRVAIHANDPQTVFVSCIGSLWDTAEDNESRGLYRTIDGGGTWQKVLSAGSRAGVVEVVINPDDPDFLYAGAWQRERRDWSWLPVGPESGVFRSIDGGGTWDRLSNGLPSGDTGRVGLSICRSQSDTIYAVTEGDGGGIYRTNDRGASWELLNTEVGSSQWYGQVRCDPNDPDRVYVLSTQFYVSEDGGETFRTDLLGNSVHVDHHALWIDPADSDHLVLGNDGGVYFSNDGGMHWRHVGNLPIMQFFEIGVDMQEPFYHVYGGTQDDMSWGGPSETRHNDGIVNDDWYMTVGGDGFYARVDPSDPTIVYSESQNGGIVRFDTRTGERKRIKPMDPEEGEGYRWNWSAPILISQHDPTTVFFAAEVLFRSPNRGDTWEVISPDLTRRLTYENQMNDYGTIRVIAESPHRSGVLAVGTDDGLVQVTQDGGETWQTTESLPGVPDLALVRRVILSVHDGDTIYVASSNHEYNDFSPYLMKSIDFGRSWISITGNLPKDQHIRALAEHPRNPDLLFIGTERGVWVSIDGGGYWVPLKNNLPTVPIHDMVVHPRENDLIVGTHGRSIWILDDINMLEELSATVATSEVRLFRVSPALQFNSFNRGRQFNGDSYYRAPNPPRGAILDYWLDPAVMVVPDSEQPPPISLEIFDLDGARVRSLDLPQGAESPGSHRVVWDMRYGPSYVPPEGEGGTVRGPWVLPGEYEARLTVGGMVSSQPVVVEPDPSVSISNEDRLYWHDTQLAVSQLLGTARSALANAKMLDTLVSSAEQAVGADLGEAQDARNEVKRMRSEVDVVTEDLGQIASRLASAYSGMQASTSLPTDDQIKAGQLGYEQLTERLNTLNWLVAEGLSLLNERLDAEEIPWSMGRSVIMQVTALPRPPTRR